MLTRIEAWRIVRRAYQMPRLTCVKSRKLPGPLLLNVWGLCNAVNRLLSYHLISHAVHRRMRKDITAQRPDGCTDDYIWPIPDNTSRVQAVNRILRRLERKR